MALGAWWGWKGLRNPAGEGWGVQRTWGRPDRSWGGGKRVWRLGLGGVERVGKPFRKLGTVARAVKRVGWGVQGVALRG